MAIEKKVKIQIRQGQGHPGTILDTGELGYDKENKKVYIGDRVGQQPIELAKKENIPTFKTINGEHITGSGNIIVEAESQLITKDTVSAENLLEISDEEYNTILAIDSEGNIKTKKFDSSNINLGQTSHGWNGKVISILGDSISSYDGYTPVADGHNLTHKNFYVSSASPWWNGNVNDTWWMRLINNLGAKLGINDSWSASRVTNSLSNNSGDLGPDACMAGMTRIENLGANGTPDLILFYGGTNDASPVHSIQAGTFNSGLNYTIDTTTKTWSDFATAYKDAIMRIQHLYPLAKILVLFPTYTKTYYSMANLDKIIEVIKEICDYFGVEYVDLRRCGINFANMGSTLGDGLHPNKLGFTMIENYVRNFLLSRHTNDGIENVVHTITNTLATNTNKDRYIKGISHGERYQATITGSQLGKIKVTMNGIDITSQVYVVSTGVITISSVTGNIIISENN